MMDMKTKKRTLLYTHNTVVNIVHASVNQDRNLLGPPNNLHSISPIFDC